MSRSTPDRSSAAANHEVVPTLVFARRRWLPSASVNTRSSGPWPLLGGSFSVNGVHVTWPRRLVKLITESPASPMNVEKVSSTLATAFPIA